MATLGGLVSSFGKDRDAYSEQRGGFRTYDPEIQQYMLETLFPRMKNYADSPYIGLTLRRNLDRHDTDPVFGSARRTQYDARVQAKAAAEAAKKAKEKA